MAQTGCSHNQVSFWPHLGQKRSDFCTAPPHCGQNPAAFSLRSLRRLAIRASRSSSCPTANGVGFTRTPEPLPPAGTGCASVYARRTAIAASSCSSSSPEYPSACNASRLRKTSTPLCTRCARWAGYSSSGILPKVLSKSSSYRAVSRRSRSASKDEISCSSWLSAAERSSSKGRAMKSPTIRSKPRMRKIEPMSITE